MDGYLLIASRREVREYDARPLPEAAVRHILEAGRVAGSAQNRQARRFVALVRDRAAIAAAAQVVYEPQNLLGAAMVVAVVVHGKGPLDFDAARAAQNMLLAAWNEGIGSCPNGITDHDRLREILGYEADERVATLLSFGYPARPMDPSRHTPQEWIARARRRPFDEVVELR